MKTPGTDSTLTPLYGAGWPLNSDAQAIEPVGFVEGEWLMSGLANRYRLPDPMRDAERIDGAHLYTTRLLVRRPRNPAQFNGTVVVEWLNVSTGQDIDFVYGATRELILRQGYAWVGVSAQRVGVERLVAWNADRYAALSVAAPLADLLTGEALDPANAFVGAAGGDVLCWDIFAQAAEAVRREALALFGTPAEARVIAAGESQAAFRLSRYYNSLQPLHGVCNGFLLYDRGGPLALRTDLSAKVISVGTEFMSAYLAAPSPDDSDHHRWWELAGAAHTSLSEIEDYVDPQVRRDGMELGGQPAGLTEILTQMGSGSPHPMWSRVPNGDVLKAALHALNRWLAGGIAPASAPRIALNAQGQVMRDHERRVLGGIRCAAYDAPSALNVGVTEGGCKLAGYHVDFSPQEMAQRYGSAAGYLARVNSIVQANLADGFLLPEDAERVIAQARAAAFGLL